MASLLYGAYLHNETSGRTTPVFIGYAPTKGYIEMLWIYNMLGTRYVLHCDVQAILNNNEEGLRRPSQWRVKRTLEGFASAMQDNT